jgi:hypothetical protein
MIKVRLRIGNSDIVDTLDEYGLVYLKSDTLFSAPLKEFDATSYPEQSGENTLDKSVANAFDYKVEFFIKADNDLQNANARIAYFNSLLYTLDGDVMTFKEVEFYNDYKKVLIVGRPSLISEASEFWRDAKGIAHDVVKVSWKIRVTNPNKCNFNLQ